MKFIKILLILPMLICGYANAETVNPRVLVAFYSLTGKTEKVADAIADSINGQLYRIELTQPYPDNKKERRKILDQEIADNYLPPLQSQDINPADYDIIFLGSPVWGNHISQPVKSFLTTYDLSGKHIIPFVTHSGGGRGQSFNDVASLCTNCVVDMDGWSSWGASTGRKLTQWAKEQINNIK